MKKRILLLFSLIPVFAAVGFAQTTRTITNADLEKFRRQREQAEADYRATYKERGMPSPEELAAREVDREKDLAERAARVRELQQRQDEIRAQENYFRLQNSYPVAAPNGNYYPQTYYYGGQISSPLIYSSGYYYRNNYRGRRQTYYNVQPHTQLAPLLPNVQINTAPTPIFTTPTRPPQRIYSAPARIGGGRSGRG